MRDVLISDTHSFSIDVPFRLIETGEKEEKPLIIYLHGYNQNIEYFRKKVDPLLSIQGYHLFIQGPYPIYDKTRKVDVSKWGRAWYLYDGDQEQFIRSMEDASTFIEQIVEQLSKKIRCSRLCIFGYSMGGYLGGYFALSRHNIVNDLVMVGARIKTEAFKGKLTHAKHITVLALHGRNDESVYPEPQKKSIELLAQKGFKTGFKLVEAGHELNSSFIDETKKWLISSGYAVD